jgi:hypothetical protein
MKLILTKEAVEWFFGRKLDYSPFGDMEKVKKICELRLQGDKYVAIGRKVGLTPDRTRHYVSRVQTAYECMLKHEDYKIRVQKNAQSLQDIYKLIEIEYDKAKQCEYIRKPLAYALHEVWRRVDKREEIRKILDGD